MLIGRREHATRDDFIGALAVRLIVANDGSIDVLEHALKAMHEQGAKVYFQGWDYSPAEEAAPCLIDHTGKMFQKRFKRRAG